MDGKMRGCDLDSTTQTRDHQHLHIQRWVDIYSRWAYKHIHDRWALSEKSTPLWSGGRIGDSCVELAHKLAGCCALTRGCAMYHLDLWVIRLQVLIWGFLCKKRSWSTRSSRKWRARKVIGEVTECQVKIHPSEGGEPDSSAWPPRCHKHVLKSYHAPWCIHTKTLRYVNIKYRWSRWRQCGWGLWGRVGDACDVVRGFWRRGIALQVRILVCCRLSMQTWTTGVRNEMVEGRMGSIVVWFWYR